MPEDPVTKMQDGGQAGTASSKPSRWRRRLFILAVVIILVVLGYAVENWRGRRAWEQCKQELQARGEKLDWEVYKPKPVPDDQNFMKAPLMDAWFNRQSAHTNEAARLQEMVRGGNDYATQHRGTSFPVLDVVILGDGEEGGALKRMPLADLEVNNPDALRRCISRAAGCGIYPDPRSSGLIVLAGAPDRKLPRAGVRLPVNRQPGYLVDKLKRWAFNVESTAETNVLRVVCPNAISAEDVEEWFEKFAPEFQALATACERPLAWIPGDYNNPVAAPIPNFVNFRMVAQVLSVRAEANLLLGKPGLALNDVRMLMRLCDALEKVFPNLVTAMIRVAIGGLLETAVGEGIRAGAWQEPQLAVLQEELGKVNLLVPFARAFRGGERAGMLHVLDQFKTFQLAEAFRSALSPGTSFWHSFWTEPTVRYICLAPRGWIAQNQVRIAWSLQTTVSRLDVEGKRFRIDTNRNPHPIQEIVDGPSTPYNYIARITVPNFIRAVETVARNQILTDMAVVACALERFRMATGNYPDSLTALSPKFAATLPHDLYTGAPLKYRRTPEGKYLLYSVGANEKDDGGLTVATETSSVTLDRGDLVWQDVPIR